LWLRHIDELRARGRTDEANREYKRFRAAYPDYSPPPARSSPADSPK
jgi:hypothetical protein